MSAGNRLANASSPYLRQHRDNPVDWYPWGTEAFDDARRRGVPILLSVGYSSCHWCHVMAHECFEDDEVATVMNQLFVNVKVDREERPDVDALYMDALQALTRRGGWPMTMFLTPSGEPFFGGTYFPKHTFLDVLRSVDDAWRTQRNELDETAQALIEAMGRTSRLQPARTAPGAALLQSALEQLARIYDPVWGGFGTEPKFPSTMTLELVMRALDSTRAPQLETVVRTTLDAMASGGMYDHLGGGFARYSTDRQWLVPHFEKMLYDQAMLLRAYVHGWQLLGNDDWAQVASETVEYVLRDLHLPGGGLCSSEDADSPVPGGGSPVPGGGTAEGAFYVWTPDEVATVLDADDAIAALEWFGITDDGNFEGHSIPNRLHARGVLRRPEGLDALRRRLLDARGERPRPGRDDKVLTEWNALFVSALAEAAGALARPDWLHAATETADFLLNNLRRADGRWMRSWQSSSGAQHDAVAADHAALVDAFTRLAEATGRARWITEAVACADTLLDHFWDPEHGGVFTTADDAEALVVRQKDIVDNAVPSANAAAALALYRLAALTGETRYANHADRILLLLADQAASAPLGFAHFLAAVALRAGGTSEVAVVGDQPEFVREVQRTYLPDTVLAWGEPYASPLWDGRSEGAAYVCRGNTCLAPSRTVDELRTALRSR